MVTRASPATRGEHALALGGWPERPDGGDGHTAPADPRSARDHRVSARSRCVRRVCLHRRAWSTSSPRCLGELTIGRGIEDREGWIRRRRLHAVLVPRGLACLVHHFATFLLAHACCEVIPFQCHWSESFEMPIRFLKRSLTWAVFGVLKGPTSLPRVFFRCSFRTARHPVPARHQTAVSSLDARMSRDARASTFDGKVCGRSACRSIFAKAKLAKSSTNASQQATKNTIALRTRRRMGGFRQLRFCLGGRRERPRASPPCVT